MDPIRVIVVDGVTYLNKDDVIRWIVQAGEHGQDIRSILIAIHEEETAE